MTEREGHAPPRIVETPAGMINAIGLQGIGVHRFVKEKLPLLRERGARVFVNVCGTTIDEYVEVSKVLSQAEGVAAIELNISCPNIKEGGIQFGCSLVGTGVGGGRGPQGHARCRSSPSSRPTSPTWRRSRTPRRMPARMRSRW